MTSERLGNGLGDSVGLSLAINHLNIIKEQDFFINQEDKKVLKDLASRVAVIASNPVQEEKKNLWYKNNSLEATRPLIFCDPENGWYEIITKLEVM